MFFCVCAGMMCGGVQYGGGARCVGEVRILVGKAFLRSNLIQY